MNKEMIMSHIDHTLLKATATWEQIEQLCQEAITYQTASVCIPASYVGRVKKTFGDRLNICTVIGFPLGYSKTAVKVLEAQEAIKDGASEIDMVVNLGDIKDHHYDLVRQEMQAIREATKGHILKVIIETCYLSEEEKMTLCQIVTECNADYIKTSTGFGTSGATVEDIKLFAQHIGPNIKIKAAGGIKTLADLETFLTLGCHRIGTSSAVKLLTGDTPSSY